jgi:hypothetical protein
MPSKLIKLTLIGNMEPIYVNMAYATVYFGLVSGKLKYTFKTAI